MKNDRDELSDDLKAAVAVTPIHRVQANANAEQVDDLVVSERAITVMIDKVGSFTIMCTPCDVEALAVGFIYSEGIITGKQDIVSVTVKESNPDVVGVVVDDPGRVAIQRNLIVASSCGMCGVRNIDKMLKEMPVCGDTLTLTAGDVLRVVENLRPMQEVFRVTGGSHAAGIFDERGEIFSVAEDIGRHSALDKAIGKCILSERSTAGCGVVLSGRVSLEMVTKAAKAGIEVIAAVSAPSSYAIEAAEKWNITLCGFVRGQRLNIYTHPHRVATK
jgi:FdhD protein